MTDCANAGTGRISIHVLRVEDDGFECVVHDCLLIFQSTSSVWRTTGYGHAGHGRVFISIHVLRVEDDLRPGLRAIFYPISIHVLRVEDDRVPKGRPGLLPYFNPRPPCGGRPFALCMIFLLSGISIHVLRVEDDHILPGGHSHNCHFNPRPPCGGRHAESLSRLYRSTISIHVLRVEDDSWQGPTDWFG